MEEMWMYELTISLDQESKVPMYEQIYQYIKNDIQKGNIRSGEKLPSTRNLSRHLDISRSTVDLAYEQLLSEGYVDAEPYRGYFVNQVEDLYQQPMFENKSQSPATIIKNSEEYDYDFSPNGVDLKHFPYSAWRKISKGILGDDETEMFRLGDSQGEYGLRNAICNYLHESRGMNPTPEQIIIGAGNDYILMLLGMILGANRRVAFENPTYKQAYHLFENLGYDIVSVDMDQKGMKIEQLNLYQTDTAYVMPSHQYPTGVVMPIKRRQELLHWAREKDNRYIIEDDYDSEFRYKGKPIPALQGIDMHQKVIYLGTFSKAIAPAIRMSYMVLPEKLLTIYYRKCRFLNSTVSRVDQMIVQQFIEGGYQERHLNKSRAMYKTRHDLLMSALKPLIESGRCQISGENAGVHLLLHFQGSIKEETLIQKAKERKIKVYGLSEYYVNSTKKRESTILLGYANMSEEDIVSAASQLVEIWK